MPTYDYICTCGTYEDVVAGINEATIKCPSGHLATRVPVYQSQGLVVRDGPNSLVPPPPKTPADQAETNELIGKEMRKRNYPSDRVYEDIRKNRTTVPTIDGNEHLGIDYSKMPAKI